MMGCESVDLKGYVLEELPAAERDAVARHASSCGVCGEQLEQLRLTHAALASVRDEEVPRRIAFVSDKIFEPKWWQFLTAVGPRWGFASAAVLALAIVAHGFVTRPQSIAPAQPDTVAVQAIVDRQVSERLTDAVNRAVAQVDAHYQKKTAELLTAATKEFEVKRQEDRLAFSQNLEVLSKRMNVMYLASAWQETEGKR